MISALTIAGSDPTGGAGVQLDIKVFHKVGIHGLSVMTALTAQDTSGVRLIRPVDTDFVEAQLRILLEDVTVEAVKTGMLYKKSAIDVVHRTIREHGIKHVVVDPVTISSSGMPLVEEGVIQSIMDQLLPLTTIVTPNVYEASLMSGITIETVEDLHNALQTIRSLGPEIVVITGGHFSATSQTLSPEGEIALDAYFDGATSHRIESERFPGEYHGTGCTFSAAITAFLSLGEHPLEAVRKAKQLASHAIRNAYHIGRGMGILGV